MVGGTLMHGLIHPEMGHMGHPMITKPIPSQKSARTTAIAWRAWLAVPP